MRSVTARHNVWQRRKYVKELLRGDLLRNYIVSTTSSRLDFSQLLFLLVFTRLTYYDVIHQFLIPNTWFYYSSRFENRRITKIGKLIATLSGRHLCEIVCHTRYFVLTISVPGIPSCMHGSLFLFRYTYIRYKHTYNELGSNCVGSEQRSTYVWTHFVHELKRENSSTRGQSYRVQDAWEKGYKYYRKNMPRSS